MARYDKYEPKSGGFRAPLAADWLLADINKVFAVGLDANGRVVKGAGQTGICGIMILTKVRTAGSVVDVMTNGEVVEMNVNHAGIVAGTTYFGNPADGTINATAPGAGANYTRIGQTVEATRLVVRIDRSQG